MISKIAIIVQTDAMFLNVDSFLFPVIHCYLGQIKATYFKSSLSGIMSSIVTFFSAGLIHSQKS